jgi:hypothetical protein
VSISSSRSSSSSEVSRAQRHAELGDAGGRLAVDQQDVVTGHERRRLEARRGVVHGGDEPLAGGRLGLEAEGLEALDLAQEAGRGGAQGDQRQDEQSGEDAPGRGAAHAHVSTAAGPSPVRKQVSCHRPGKLNALQALLSEAVRGSDPEKWIASKRLDGRRPSRRTEGSRKSCPTAKGADDRLAVVGWGWPFFGAAGVRN